MESEAEQEATPEGDRTRPSEGLAQIIHDLEAERAIRHKIAAYARACDRLDLDLAATLFAKDSYVDYGSGSNGVIFRGTGAELMKWLHGVDSNIYAGGGQFQHVLSQTLIEVKGNVAASETYGYAVVMIPGQNGRNRITISYARYLDRWECQEGDWLIIRRVVTSDGGFTLETDFPLYERYNFATDRSDPSYKTFEDAVAKARCSCASPSGSYQHQEHPRPRPPRRICDN